MRTGPIRSAELGGEILYDGRNTVTLNEFVRHFFRVVKMNQLNHILKRIWALCSLEI
jgi:hypothetical protein